MCELIYFDGTLKSKLEITVVAPFATVIATAVKSTRLDKKKVYVSSGGQTDNFNWIS